MALYLMLPADGSRLSEAGYSHSDLDRPLLCLLEIIVLVSSEPPAGNICAIFKCSESVPSSLGDLDDNLSVSSIELFPSFLGEFARLW